MDELELLRRRMQRLETLHRLALRIHATLDSRAALACALAESMRILRADSGSVSLVNPKSGLLEIEAMQGLPDSVRSVRIRVSDGITGWVARNGRTARVDDVLADPRYVEIRRGVRSEVAVPLRVGEECRGVLNLDADRERAFSAEDQEFLEALAAMLAPAIHSIWLYESVRQKARLLESLVRVGQIINSTLSRDDTLGVIAREACTLMSVRMCSVMMLDAAGARLDLVAHFGASESFVKESSASVAESFLGTVIRRRKPLQVENLQLAGFSENDDMARRCGLVSLLAVPLTFSGKAMGTLNVYTDRIHLFSDEEVRALTAYAELSVVALEKARLYERTVALEDELRQSERLSALGLLAAEVAHEIRNPLTVIKMLHHSLDLKFEAGDPRSTDVRIMGEKMDHLNQIVDRVLDFARRTEPSMVSLNANQLLDDLGLLTRHKLKSQGVRLVRKLDSRLPAIFGDRTQLEQVFLNLTLNAVEAMPGGGVLTVRSRALFGRGKRVATHIAVRFRDTGVGMTKEQCDRAFTSLLGSTKVGGTGLGLAIVYRVVEQHQGRVRAYSALGRGARFLLVLPVSR